MDDIIVKSCTKDHLLDLKEVFILMRTYQVKMNLTKSFLRVSNGKSLGFIVTYKGIHLDPEKVCAIKEMQLLINLRELKGL